ncbi:MAG: hypothetical protein H8E57_05680 [Candidatus Cloacimonetes bacterium]|nr:hypothetical protein [Candidatus Cloacimonadota bacterium]
MAKYISPTITLANIYESQNQFIDALVIYKFLQEINPSNNFTAKIENLSNRIFDEKKLKNLEIIDKIFSYEEKKYFKILNHEQYQNYKEAVKQNKNIEIDSHKISKKEMNELIAFPEFLHETDEIDIPEFKSILKKKFGEEMKLKDLKLSEIHKVIDEYKNINAEKEDE